MARLDSWLSPHLTHALGLALIHSLWQGVALAALAAVLMAFSRRPSLRYAIAAACLIAMLAVPLATFLALAKPGPLPSLAPARAEFSAAPQVPLASDIATLAQAPETAHAIVIAGPASRAGFLAAHLPRFRITAILPWLVTAWLLGVALFSLRLAGGLLLLEHRRRQPASAPAPHILALGRELERRLGLTRAIRYLECGWIQAPAVIGWLRPIVLLPIAALTGLNEAQLRAVIAHELAHIKRLDPFVNLLQALAETLLFYHPAVWWLNRRIRAERELACDEIAVALTGNRLEYARTLTLMAQWGEAPALAMAANRGSLTRRVLHILGRKPSATGPRLLGLTGSLLFLAAAIGAANALFGIAAPKAHAKEEPAPPKEIAAVFVPSIETIAAATPAPRAQIEQRLVRAAKFIAPLPDVSRLLQAPAVPELTAANDPLPAPMPVALAHPKAPLCTRPAIADSAALDGVPGTALKTVPVAINGIPKKFLLDIGTGRTEISRAAVRDLALPDADNSLDLNAVAAFDVKGGGAYHQFARIAAFTMGGATGHDLAFVIAQDPQMGKSKPYDGLMTGDFFKQYNVEVDFAANRLAYLTPTGCADPDQIAYWPHEAVAAIPVGNWNGKIQVQVTIEGKSIPAVIDTSSPHTVMRRDIAELLLGLKAGTQEMTPDGDVRDGTGQQVYRHGFARISFAGGVTAYNVPGLIQTGSMVRDPDRTPILGSRAQFAADPRQRIPALTLGMDVLGQLHLLLVPGDNTLYVTPASSEAGTMAEASPGAATGASGSSM